MFENGSAALEDFCEHRLLLLFFFFLLFLPHPPPLIYVNIAYDIRYYTIL
jgi:hypothetical protein